MHETIRPRKSSCRSSACNTVAASSSRDRDVEIFHQLKAMVESGAKTGEVDKDIKKKLKKKQGELVMTPYIANDGKIWYSVTAVQDKW